MDDDSKALRTVKRLSVALPLLALPFVPAIGKIVGGFLFVMYLPQVSLQ